MVFVTDQMEEGAHCSLDAVDKTVLKNSKKERHRIKLFWRSNVHFGQEREGVWYIFGGSVTRCLFLYTLVC